MELVYQLSAYWPLPLVYQLSAYWPLPLVYRYISIRVSVFSGSVYQLSAYWPLPLVHSYRPLPADIANIIYTSINVK